MEVRDTLLDNMKIQYEKCTRVLSLGNMHEELNNDENEANLLQQGN